MPENPEDLRSSAPIEDFLIRGGSVPVDLPIGIINPAAISSLIEQNGGGIGRILTIASDGVARWLEITDIPGPGGTPIINFPKTLDDLLDVTLSGQNTCDFLVFTGSFWTNAPAKACLPPEIVYEDEVNIFTEINEFTEELRRPIKTIGTGDSPYSVVPSNWHINALPDISDIIAVLPDAASAYNPSTETSAVLTIKNTSASSRFEVTIKTAISGQLIDGLHAVAIRTPYKSLTFVSDGSNWFIQ